MGYTIHKLRGAYFATAKALGMSEEDRHNFNESRTGKASTKEFSQADWESAVAELQRLAGQDALPGHPQLKSEDAAALSERDGVWATDAQCRFIEDLCERIEWRRGRQKGPILYVLQHFLWRPEMALRRERLTASAKALPDSAEKWRALSRQEANAVILALRRMARRYAVQKA